MILICNILLHTSCVKDGEDLTDCKTDIQFVYDYNMAFVDKFSIQATKMNLYIYNSEGIFVKSMTDEKANYFPKDYKMTFPDNLPDGAYTLMAWSGLYNESYDYFTPIAEKSTLSEFIVKVKNYESSYVDFQMKPLWYGTYKLQFNKRDNVTHLISLMKDTKSFRVVMQNLTDGKNNIDVNDYKIEIVAANGMYDYTNAVSGNLITYTPYYAYNDALAGAVTELNTQRLMADSNNRLRIIDKNTNNSIVDINLDKYLAVLRLQEFKDIPYQEYLDREDSFAIIFFFEELDPEGKISFKIKINDWFVREQEGDL